MSPGPGITSADVGQALARVGVEAGDTLMLHGDAMAAAQMTSVPLAQRPQALLEAIQEHLGPGGTLVLPVFTYSFTKGEDFDPAVSPGQVGLLGERFRHMPGVRRSLDPLFSVAARGAKAEELTSGDAAQCFGPDSFFGRLHRARGKIACLGCTLQVVTFLHYVERDLSVDYRFDKQFQGRVRQPGGQWRDTTVTYFVRDLERDSESVLLPLERRLETAGRLRRTSLGRVGLICVDCDDFYDQTRALLAQHPLALIKEGAGQAGAAPGGMS
ncbi:MAG: AAC(3) family N-acetyltransferase [Desulfarculus sp.]|nr:AAC(3) family N-acetyltransferase [Desulfarculus sp.]